MWRAILPPVCRLCMAKTYFNERGRPGSGDLSGAHHVHGLRGLAEVGQVHFRQVVAELVESGEHLGNARDPKHLNVHVF